MGGLFYPSQVQSVLIGSKTDAGTRTGVALTSSYQAEGAGAPTKTWDVGGMTRVDFAVAYTMGATETANSIEIIVEWSPDLVNFYPLVTDSTSAGTSTLTEREFKYVGTTNAGLSEMTFGIDVSYKEALRISCKESGVVTNAGNVFIEVVNSGR